MNKMFRILLIEDNPGDARLIEEMLKEAGVQFEMECVERLSSGIGQIKLDGFDVILLDLGLPDSQGLSTLMKLNEIKPDAPVIVLTGLADEATGMQAIKEGAQDYLIKGQVDKNLLSRSINYAVERKKAEEALGESEERYRTLVEQSPDMIGVLVDGRLAYLNPAGLRLFGAAHLEQMLHKSITDYMHPEDLNTVRERVRRAAEEALPNQPTELRIFRLDGTVTHIEGVSTPLVYKGQPAVQFICRDITERKKAEEKLLENETRLRTLSDNLPGGLVYQIDSGEDGLQRRFSYISANIEQLHGITEAEALKDAMAIYGQVVEEDRHMVAEREALALKNMTPFSAEVRLRLPSGEIRWGLFASAPRRLPNNHLVWDGIEINITERKQLEESLNKQRKQFETFFYNSITSLAFLDKDFNFIRVNKAYADADEKEISYFPGRNHFELYPSDAKAMFDDVVRTKTSFQAFARPFIYPDHPDRGVTFWDWTLVPIMDNKGEVEFLVLSLVNVTEKKKLEGQLRQSQKMEAVGQIAGGIAHDFNNILTAIIGYASLLQMKMGEDDPLKVYIEPIITSTERAANLTQGLLAFSRKQISNPAPVNMNELIKKVEKFLKRVIGEDIELQAILADKDITVMADSGQIEQVLMNLATNARDAMPTGGLLTIENGTVEIDDEYIKAHGYGKAGMYALISVTDSGVGMDEKTRGKIFEPFFTTKEVGKGTGLGLSIVYGIVKQHNGYINCYSEPGKGTTFRIYLPLIQTALNEAKPVEVIGPVGGTETILLAEDEENVRDITRLVLEEYGYKVIEAIDGEDAVNKFMENKDKIDLLLFDVIMPKMSGKEAFDMIRKIRPDIKVLFASGYPADFIHRKKIDEEGLPFVVKPISPTALIKKVREVMDK